MPILLNQPPLALPAGGPLSPLNAVWLGSVSRPVTLPHYGHLLLVFPLAGTVVSDSGISAGPNHYLLMATAVEAQPITLHIAEAAAPGSAAVLANWQLPAGRLPNLNGRTISSWKLWAKSCA
jgi:hypothetical protein